MPIYIKEEELYQKLTKLYQKDYHPKPCNKCFTSLPSIQFQAPMVVEDGVWSSNCTLVEANLRGKLTTT